ncbi:cysteine desulfurase family protein [Planctomycetota bacterium]
MNESIYLDNNATTQTDPVVAAAMYECLLAGYANPASQHQAGQRAHVVLEDARERIAAILNVDISSPSSDRLVFTSGGTEANNFALRGLGKPTELTPRKVIVSSIEHPSILTAAQHLPKTDHVRFVPALQNGLIDLERLADLISDRSECPSSECPRTLVSMMLGNNETGSLQPIANVNDLLDDFRSENPDETILFHTDAVQVAGKLPVDFRSLGVSAMSVSAHKFHGPCGIGALAIRRGVSISPLLFGGSQQLKLRPGTESVVGAVGMAVALEKWKSVAESRTAKMLDLRNRFERALDATIGQILVNGCEADRLPNTSNVSFLGVDRQALLMALDFAGVHCSTGSACESGSSEPSHVLKAMGLSKEAISSAIRFSLSAFNTSAEIDEAVRRISKSVKGLRKGKSGPFSS